MPHLKNLTNEYIRGWTLFDRIPKSVFAAIALSFAMRLSEDNWQAAEKAVMAEWETLHQQGIIPQRPPA